MGRRGPPPLPREIKEQRGTLRKHRESRSPPRAPAGTPSIPRHLSPVARAKWRELLPQLRLQGTMSPVDRTTLEMLCSAYSDYRDAQGWIKKYGSTMVVKQKVGDEVVEVLKAHPAVAARESSWRRYMVAMREFGLSPASRSRVEADMAGAIGVPGPAPPTVAGPPPPRPRIPVGTSDPLAQFLPRN